MGSDSIVKLLDKVSDSKFKTDLTDQLNGYEGFASKAKARLKEMGAEAKEENVMVKLWSSIGMAMSTLTDSTDSHIAELIAEGSTMGITDGIKLLRVLGIVFTDVKLRKIDRLRQPFELCLRYSRCGKRGRKSLKPFSESVYIDQVVLVYSEDRCASVRRKLNESLLGKSVKSAAYRRSAYVEPFSKGKLDERLPALKLAREYFLLKP